MSLMNFVGLASTIRVSALPFASTSKTTEVLMMGLGVSEIDDKDARFALSRFKGEERRGRLTAELLLAKLDCTDSGAL